MAALTFAPSAALVSPTRSVAIKKAFSGVKSTRHHHLCMLRHPLNLRS